MVQWYRIPPTMQGARAGSLVQEYCTGHKVTKAVHCDSRARELLLLKTECPRARAPQRKPPP